MKKKLIALDIVDDQKMRELKMEYSIHDDLNGKKITNFNTKLINYFFDKCIFLFFLLRTFTDIYFF